MKNNNKMEKYMIGEKYTNKKNIINVLIGKI